MKVDIIEALLPVSQRNIGEVYIDRVSGQVFQEEIYGGAAMDLSLIHIYSRFRLGTRDGSGDTGGERRQPECQKMCIRDRYQSARQA